MAADQFVFRHFIINQEKCPMKVGTDALVLGAYVQPYNAKTMLDIGTGTGILALILAQKSGNDARIDAVDIDQECAAQAAGNFKTSSWHHKLQVHHASIVDFMPVGQPLGYDLIISNPPYFKPNMKAEKESEAYAVRKNARSFAGITYDQLLSEAYRLLQSEGRFYVIIPAGEAEIFTQSALSQGLYLFDNLFIFSKEGQKPVRSIIGFKKQADNVISEQKLVIYEADGTYTNAYIALTENYYAMDMRARKQKRRKAEP